MNTSTTSFAVFNLLIMIVASVALTGSWAAPFIYFGIMGLSVLIHAAGLLALAAAFLGGDKNAIKANIDGLNKGAVGVLFRIAAAINTAVLMFLLAPGEMAAVLAALYLVLATLSELGKGVVRLIKGAA